MSTAPAPAARISFFCKLRAVDDLHVPHIKYPAGVDRTGMRQRSDGGRLFPVGTDVRRAPPQTARLHRSFALKRIAYTALHDPYAPPGLFCARKIARQTCTAAPCAPSPSQHGTAHPRREPPHIALQPALRPSHQ